MKLLKTKRINLILTRHAIKRACERGLTTIELSGYLRRSKFILMSRNGKGYEILIPMKGRLVGDFDSPDNFVIKSFLYPFLHSKIRPRCCNIVAIRDVHFL